MLIIHQQGLTLIETMVGVVVGLLVLASMVYYLSSLSMSSVKSMQSLRLEHELQTAIELMALDIRRAGYWGNASSMIGIGSNTNPFMSTGTDLSVPSSTCILFTYDLDKNGAIPALNTAGSDERFGYRLSGNLLQTRAVTDSSFSCNAGTWENLTDPNVVQITNLQFTPTTSTVSLTNPATTESINIRNVAISITGRLTDDNTVTKTLSTNVRVRNDKYTP